MKRRDKQPAILFMVPSPLGISPGQRFRFEQYLHLLEERGIHYKISPYLSLQGRKALYRKGNELRKFMHMLGGAIRRFIDLFTLRRYEYVYIHRWATTAGPPLFEWIITRIFRKKMVYDFDDAIWVKESAYNKKYLAVKFLGKISRICKLAHIVSVGNNVLYQYAKKFNSSVRILPTVVNTHTVHSQLQDQRTGYPAIGWTGSFSTLIYLEMILPVISRLQEKYDFIFYVIADRDPQPRLKNYKFIPWHRETEPWDLMKFHIGLMPLPDDDITRGKCGFKAIQYMSLGIPPVVSPVGVNTEIVTDGLEGFICETGEEWELALEKLLTDPELRERMGKASRLKIESHYSVQSTTDQFMGLFQRNTREV